MHRTCLRPYICYIRYLITCHSASLFCLKGKLFTNSNETEVLILRCELGGGKISESTSSLRRSRETGRRPCDDRFASAGMALFHRCALYCVSCLWWVVRSSVLSAYSVQPTSFPYEIPHLLFTPTKTSTFSSVLIVFRTKQLVGISRSHLSTLVHAQELGAKCQQMLKHSTLGLSENLMSLHNDFKEILFSQEC